MATIDILDTAELLGVLQNFPPQSNYWRDLCFRDAHYSNDEWIYFDQIDKGRRLAPFVAHNVQGQPTIGRKETVRKFKPAYIKPKDPIDLNRAFRRRAGEAITGSLSPQERIDAAIAATFEDHVDMIDRRLEWMAAEAVIKGSITVSGENYPTRTLDFGRAAANTVVLTTTARWNDSAPDPYGNIKAWTAILAKSGRQANRITMGINVAEYFFNNAKIDKMLETRRGSSASMERFQFQGGQVATYYGTLPGGIEVWTYNDVYEENDGFETPFMSPNDIVITGDVGGVQCFGAIMDAEAGFAPYPMYPSMWKSKDPSGIFCMTQSAPLMVPLRPNASFRATVL